MADLNEINSSGSTKIVGSDVSGVEQTPVQSTSSGGLHVNLRNNAGTEITTLPVSIAAALPAGSNIIGSFQNSSGASAIVLSALGDFFLNTSMQKYSGVVFNVTGTWVGTIQALASFDGGSTYAALPVVSITDAEATTSINVNTNGSYFFPIPADTIKISFISYTSGTATVRTSYTTGSQNPSQNPLLAQIAKVSISDSYVPRLPYSVTGVGRLITDADNQLITRGDVLTDEGTFRDDFVGSSLNLTQWTQSFSGTGANVTVGSSLVSVISGTANAGTSRIVAGGDYGPISLRSQFSLSQRIANQTTRFGFADDITNPAVGAYFQFTGTSNTVVDCISRSSASASDTQTTSVTIPNGTSATSNDYYIEIQPDQVTFFINGFRVAQHRLHMPGPYDAVDIGAYIVNTAAVTNTNLIIDYVYFINQNSLQINNSFLGDDLIVKVNPTTTASYSAAVVGLVAVNTPTDIFTISGSATKTIRVTRISITATQTTATQKDIVLLRRSTANTAGTSTAPAKVPHDSTNPAATNTVLAYTANPTLGTLVGNIRTRKVFIGTNTGNSDEFIVDFGTRPSQGILLRGVNEILSINLNSITSAGNSFDISVEWTEE